MWTPAGSYSNDHLSLRRVYNSIQCTLTCMQRNHLAALLVAVALLGLVAVGTVTALDNGDNESVTANQTSDQTIHVSGSGVAETAPDQAALAVAITAEGETVQSVRDDLAIGADELTSALDDLGVDYETTRYDVGQPRHPPDAQDVPSYVGSHSFGITLDNPDRVGTVIDAAVNAGAEINDVSLTLSDDQRTALRDDAIEAAMSDARQQADTIAATSGLTVTGVTAVDASQRSFNPVAYDAELAVEETDDAGPPTEIVSGDVSITYTVDVTYEAAQQ